MCMCVREERGCITSEKLFFFPTFTHQTSLSDPSFSSLSVGSKVRVQQESLNTCPRAGNLGNLDQGAKSRAVYKVQRFKSFQKSNCDRDHISKEDNDARSLVFYKERGDIMVV